MRKLLFALCTLLVSLSALAGVGLALEVPPHWGAPFARLVRELGLPITDLTHGIGRVQEFVDRIAGAHRR